MKLFKQIITFGIVGGICFVIDYGIMLLFTEICVVNYLISCIISFTISTIVNYILSMKFVFPLRRKQKNIVEFVFFMILSLLGLGLTELLMWVFVDKITLHYAISKIIVTIIVMVFSFVTRKLCFEKKE